MNKLIKKIRKRSNAKGRQTQRHRVTTVNNSFVQAILPNLTMTDSELAIYLKHFKVKDRIPCIYCRDNEATTIDHLFCIVKQGQASGYIDEIANMVPSCGPCNSSKSNIDYDKWLMSKKIKNEGRIKNINAAIARVEKFRKVFKARKIEMNKICVKAGVQKEYQEYLKLQIEIQKLMLKAEKDSKIIKKALDIYLAKK